jgi:mRNA-degrading endonuclease RelE of RelBE toxin-antitoxin system
MSYRVGFTEPGRLSFLAFEKNVRRDVFRAIVPLADEPKAGKPLVGSLSGLYSLRVRNHYRVVYRIDDQAERIYVEFVGERKPGRQDDVYQAARRLLENLGG